MAPGGSFSLRPTVGVAVVSLLIGGCASYKSLEGGEPKTKQKFVMEMLDTVLAQAGRSA